MKKEKKIKKEGERKRETTGQVREGSKELNKREIRKMKK